MYSRTTGRRKRPPYLDVINEQAPLGMNLAFLEDEREAQRKRQELNERTFAHTQSSTQDKLGLEREQMEEAKEQADKANKISTAQTAGLGAYTAYKAGAWPYVKGAVGTVGGAVTAVGTGVYLMAKNRERVFKEAQRTGSKSFSTLGKIRNEGSRAVEHVKKTITDPVGTVEDAVEDVEEAVEDLCIITTTATNPYSYEVNTTREYRDRYLSQQTLRGYYIVAETIVPLMRKSGKFKKFIKKCLVDAGVKYCEWMMGKRKEKPVLSSLITTTFLKHCDKVGSRVKSFIRSNGEVW